MTTTTPQKQQKQMAEIDVDEVSAVDWPAHLAPGWVVCKSATKQDVEALFGTGTTEGKPTMATETQGTPSVEDLAKQVEEMTKSLAAAEQATADATARAEAAEAQVAKAAEPGTNDKEDVLKGASPEIVAYMAKAEAAAEALRKEQAETAEELRKERDARLDEKAQTEYAGMFKALAIETDAVAPHMRRLATTDPELHKSVLTAMQAAEAQLTAAGIFKSIGKDGEAATDAKSAIDQAVAKAMTDDPNLSKPAAMAKAFEENPALAENYYTEAGK